MRWRGGRRSDNIEDRRGAGEPGGGMGGGFRMPGGFGGGMRFPGAGGAGMSRGVKRGGIGGIGLIIIVLIALFFGFDPSMLLQGGSMTGDSIVGAPSSAVPPAHQSAEERELSDFVSVVLADTEDTWHALFGRFDRAYEEPTLVLFSGQVHSACGMASAAVGPFYCPADRKVYIDLAFYRDLRDRFRAPGDFAQAYVIAHEVGHHVQTLLGISDQVEDLRRRLDPAEANRLSVMMELQADCLSGVWAHHADRSRQILEAGDIEEGLNAASAIGDDRLQRQQKGHVTPDSFTHGTSTQRVRWFKRGLETGDLQSCDTFKAETL